MERPLTPVRLPSPWSPFALPICLQRWKKSVGRIIDQFFFNFLKS